MTDPAQPLLRPAAQGLYDPASEHDACGVGFVANIKGARSHTIIEQGLLILKNLAHRGAVGADPLASDGAGILIQIPDRFLREEMAGQGVQLPPAGEYGVGMVFLPQEPLRAWPANTKSNAPSRTNSRCWSVGVTCRATTRGWENRVRR